MKKEYVDFVCNLHGYLIRIKEIHWNTNTNAEHLLCDEIQDNIMECEDRFMECCMGISGEHFQLGKLLPMLPNAKELLPMLKELEKDILNMKKNASSDEESGLMNILDEMLECCNKFKYRATQK